MKGQLVRERIPGAPGGEGKDTVIGPEARHDLERLSTDRAGRAEDGDARHTVRPATSSA
jgi:hypothetical protein